ncbi:MAG TPA: NADPH-dependent 7-cyano-7-deazaguanine reductase QueF [Dongiaceae bacterium]|nr:NADPH-dependent 7-cyano-7-deazaguanine reductase QueF [Dongiaceae bacterium]
MALPTDHGPLGQKSEYPDVYAPQVLYPIARTLGRNEIGLTQGWPFHGEDVWNAYEMSWLDPTGKPQVATAELRVPAQSLNIVESKSLKLYFGSFNQTAFADWAAVSAAIEKDVSAAAGALVSVRLLALTAQQEPLVALPGECIDDEPVQAVQYQVNPDLLRLEPTASAANPVSETLHSHLLRSCCPVTGQPDWASLLIQYRGAKISRSDLLRYLISFRNNQEFHEQCVERIFMDIQQRCQPLELTVYARYTRRGGIDINPWRSSLHGSAPNWRLVRQ